VLLIIAHQATEKAVPLEQIAAAILCSQTRQNAQDNHINVEAILKDMKITSSQLKTKEQCAMLLEVR
jgi:hypothetical protein